MSVHFAEPVWFVLLAIAVPVSLVGLRWFASMSRARRVSAVLARVVLIALISAILAGVSTVRQTSRLAVVAVVDVSGSVRRFAAGSGGEPDDPVARVSSFLDSAIADRGPDDLLGVVVFDGRCLAVATPTRADISDRSLDVRMAEGTDIAGALRYALALIPPDASGRLVLVSDGNETAGDAREAAREAAGRSAIGEGVRGAVPIDVAPLNYDVSREVIVESVDAPPHASSESAVTVRVVLNATDGSRGVLRLVREGRELDINGDAPGTGRAVTLEPGRNIERIEVALGPGKVHRFEASYEPVPLRGGGFEGDTHLDNNRGEAFTITPGKGTVLIVDGVGGGRPGGVGGTLAHTLEDQGIEVRMLGPGAMPDTLLGLQAYDLVMLQNVPADALSVEAQAALGAYVRDLGGGLVMIGGPDSFGAGGWKGTDVEPILPVRLDLPERLVMPAAAIVLVLDCSGSMAQSVMGSARSQQDVANEAAALAVTKLDKTDLVGVISFSSLPRDVVELAPNADPEQTAARIRSIGPGGGTDIVPALQRAYQWLADVDAQVKHVIVLTDGRSAGAALLPALAARMSGDGINVSTIGVGDDADEQTLSEMAAVGGGVYYPVRNPNRLPRVFVRAVRIVRSPMVREKPFTPVVMPTGSPLVAGLSDVPPLGGLVLTQARDEPTITYAMMAPSGEPVLGYWNVELGRVAAFTSDAHDWAAPWLDWPGYAEIWTRIARTIARPVGETTGELLTEVIGDRMSIRLEARDEAGKPIGLLTVPVSVYGPGGGVEEYRLTQVGPGAYEAEIPARDSGNYIVIAKPRLGAKRLAPALGGTSAASGVEYRRLRSDPALLADVAQVTGGRVLDMNRPDLAELYDRTGIEPTLARTPIWRGLLIWTLVVLLLDVGTRRIAWDRFLSREYGAQLVRPIDRTKQAAQTLSALRSRGRRDRPETAAGGALTERDAAKVAAEAARRRHAAQLEAYRALRQRGAAAEDAPEVEAEGEHGAEQPPTSGLLAAKRRAQQRFRNEEPQE